MPQQYEIWRLNMNKYFNKSLQKHPYAPQNIGIIDRTARIIVGTILIGAWFILPYPLETGSIIFALLPFLGVFPVVTGIIGWCPTYAMLKTKSCGTGKRNNCGTFPDQLDHLINPH